MRDFGKYQGSRIENVELYCDVGATLIPLFMGTNISSRES